MHITQKIFIVLCFIFCGTTVYSQSKFKSTKHPIPPPVKIKNLNTDYIPTKSKKVQIVCPPTEIKKTSYLNISYKSIKPLNINYYQLSETPGVSEAMKEIQALDNDIEEYLLSDKYSLAQKESLYELYLKNLYYYASRIQTFNILESNDYIIDFANLHKSKSIRRVNFGEGFVGPEIDAEFQYNLSQSLNINWQQYWRIRRQEQKFLDDSASIYIDGSRIVKLNVLAEWLVLWSKFQNKNTNPDLAYDIHKRINNYIDAFLSPNVYDYENWGNYIIKDYTDNPKPIRPITPKGKIEIENLLKNLDKDTYAYKIIKNAYETLKCNNFITSEKYYNSYRLK